MFKIHFLFTLLLYSCLNWAYSQELYSKTFGDSESPAVIFLHGGPGYNCATFEGAAAQNLADKGFYVIVYDRRGEGRSEDENTFYTFKETNKDLKNLYSKYKIKKAILIGHSFGGIVGTKFTEKYAKKVSAIVLVGAPVSLQKTFKNIIKRSKALYTSSDDSTNLNYISMLENMDTTSLNYSSYCFMHAMSNGFYAPKKMSEEAQMLYEKLNLDTTLSKYTAQMTMPGPLGFWNNEQYTTIDLTISLIELKAKGIPIFGLYGQGDGLYSKEQIKDLERIIGKENVQYLPNCSHSVFIDQQSEFIKTFISISNAN